jgi:hypothetical protein
MQPLSRRPVMACGGEAIRHATRVTGITLHALAVYYYVATRLTGNRLDGLLDATSRSTSTYQ